MLKEFPAQESEHRVRTTTYKVTAVFADGGKEDLAAKIKRLILDEKPCKAQKSSKNQLGSDK